MKISFKVDFSHPDCKCSIKDIARTDRMISKITNIKDLSEILLLKSIGLTTQAYKWISDPKNKSIEEKRICSEGSKSEEEAWSSNALQALTYIMALKRLLRLHDKKDNKKQ